MTRISIGLPMGATNTTPTSPLYERTGKDGTLNIINFLLGSHYGVNVNGIFTTTSSGNIADQSVSTSGGMLQMVCKSNDATLVQNIATFSSFMFFFPKTMIEGNSVLQHATVTTGQTEKLRHIITDLATGDAIIVDWASGITGSTNATLTIQQVVAGVTTTLASVQATTNAITEMYWEIVYQDIGGTKISYMQPNGTKTLLWRGNLTANVGECKVQIIEYVTATADTTLQSDFFWVFYPAVYCGYDVPNLAQRALGNVKCWDDMGSNNTANWVQVFSSDHQFTGNLALENGFIQLRVNTVTMGIDVYGWSNNSTAYVLVGTMIPEDINGNLAVVYNGLVFSQFNDGEMEFTINWGILSWEIDMRRGNPYVRVILNSTHLRFNTSKPRFAISTPSPYTLLPSWNQKGAAAANGGNPLNLVSPSSPYSFTNDANTNTGLLNIDDNWYAFFDPTKVDDMLGFVATIQKPTGLTLSAISATQLQYADFLWPVNSICAVGVLEGDSLDQSNSIPVSLAPIVVDQYVKWRANESIYTFDQAVFVRRKR